MKNAPVWGRRWRSGVMWTNMALFYLVCVWVCLQTFVLHCKAWWEGRQMNSHLRLKTKRTRKTYKNVPSLPLNTSTNIIAIFWDHQMSWKVIILPFSGYFRNLPSSFVTILARRKPSETSSFHLKNHWCRMIFFLLWKVRSMSKIDRRLRLC